MSVMHLAIKFGADIFIQSELLKFFSAIQDGGRHLGFVGGSNGITHEGSSELKS